MLFFKHKTNTQPVADTTPAKKAMVFSGRPSKKRKNTYRIKFSAFMDATMFELRKKTPLAIVTINGKQAQSAQDWLTCTDFPNPGANVMVTAYNNPIWRDVAGEKLATTIVEYRDKFTDKPVLVLFPTNNVESLVPGEDWTTVANSRLSRAARQDLWYQIHKVRLPKIQEFKNRMNAR